jgi:hypothetical protein
MLIVIAYDAFCATSKRPTLVVPQAVIGKLAEQNREGPSAPPIIIQKNQKRKAKVSRLPGQ